MFTGRLARWCSALLTFGGLLVSSACSQDLAGAAVPDGSVSAPDVGAGGGAGDDASSAADASASDAGVRDGGLASPRELVERGELALTQVPRPAYGALVVVQHGARIYAVESRRDLETGPFNLPWRSRFRLAAYDGDGERWAFKAEPDDVIGDVAVHPSGELTLSLLRHAPERLAYELVRLSPEGELLAVTVLPQPTTVPAGDYGPDEPRPLFRMKSAFADALTAGWLRLLPAGEGIVAAFLSFVDAPEGDPRRTRLALGLASYAWERGYVERWARVVEGMHAAEPAAWAYDELRWREQAVRPFLARDEASGDLLVGRAFNKLRCEALVAVFAEFAAADCVFDAVDILENERLPLAVTRFGADGKRLGTRVLATDPGAIEQVPFALAARDGELAVVGSVVRSAADGSRRTYPDADGFVDYDAYVSVYDAQGTLLRQRDINLGRGDVLANFRWTEAGLIAVGSTGWDRGQSGMSILRGADPLLVWLSHDLAELATRVVPLSDGRRHFSLHDLAVQASAVVGWGVSDAPMTHSADRGNDAARTFGGLQVWLAQP